MEGKFIEIHLLEDQGDRRILTTLNGEGDYPFVHHFIIGEKTGENLPDSLDPQLL